MTKYVVPYVFSLFLLRLPSSPRLATFESRGVTPNHCRAGMGRSTLQNKLCARRLVTLLILTNSLCATFSNVETPCRFGNHQGGRSVGRKKIRHHVNPLKSYHSRIVDLPAHWPATFFACPENPLHIDIGCARGLFCLQAADTHPLWNYLGLEIRSVMVDAAREEAAAAGLRNANFLACNANANACAATFEPTPGRHSRHHPP